MKQTGSSSPRHNRSAWLAWARFAVFVLGIGLTLFALYNWAVTVYTVAGQPELVLPDADYWDANQLQQAQVSLGLPTSFFANYALVLNMIFSLTFLVAGWLILWRKSQDWFGLYLGLLLLSWATTTGVFVSMPPLAGWAITLERFLTWFVWPGFFLLLFFFPSGHVTPRWARWFALILVLFIVYGWIITFLKIDPESMMLAAPFIIICLIIGGYSQIYRYRHAGPLERQQVKWVVFALLLFVLFFITIFLLINLAGLGDPARNTLISALLFSMFGLLVGNLALMSLPITIVLAVLRYRLWDIDVIIRRTLVYGVLTTALALVYFGSVVLLQQVVGGIAGIKNSPVVTILSTLAIWALFAPLRRRIQAFIDRLFFRKKYDAQKVLEGFASSVRNEVELERLTAHLLSVVEETMQPESVSLWLKAGKK